LYTFSEQILGYAYAVQSLMGRQVDIKLDFTKSQNMLFSSKENATTKTIEPNQTEFMMHTMARPQAPEFKRHVKCTVREH